MKKLLAAAMALCLLVSCKPADKPNNNETNTTVTESTESTENTDNADTTVNKGEEPMLNSIAYKTFGQVLKETDFENTVYSPFSYGQALKTLTSITDDFKDNEYLKDFYNESLPESLANLVSKNLILANKDLLELGNNTPEELKYVEFPKEASDLSEKLQNEVLNEVLIKPEYDKDQSSVILNVVNFKGKWEKPFVTELTMEQVPFNTGKEEVKTDLMTEQNPDGKKGYDDDLAVATRKPLKKYEDKSSYVYVIVPNEVSENAYEQVSNNIDKYVEGVRNSNEDYDDVLLQMPKLDLKTELDLLKVAQDNGQGIDKPFDFKEDVLISKTGDKSQIDAIKQVSTLYIDEKTVEAKAATQIETRVTSAPIEQNNLEVIANKPYFVVITSSDENGNEVVTFTSFVRNPNNK